jgi:hypothetical protein
MQRSGAGHRIGKKLQPQAYSARIFKNYSAGQCDHNVQPLSPHSTALACAIPSRGFAALHLKNYKLYKMRRNKGNDCRVYLNVTKAEWKLVWSERVQGGKLTEMHYARLRTQINFSLQIYERKMGEGGGLMYVKGVVVSVLN